MYYFFSPKTHRGLRIWDKGKKLANFENMADYGYFCTEDEEIAQALREYPLFNIAYRESKDGKLPNFEKPVAVNYKVTDNGVETVRVNQEPEPVRVVVQEPKVSPEKLIRYGELKAKLYNEKGELKKFVKKEDKERQAQLVTEFLELKKIVEV